MREQSGIRLDGCTRAALTAVSAVLLIGGVAGQATERREVRRHTVARVFAIDAPQSVRVTPVFPGEHAVAKVDAEAFEVGVFVGRTAGRSNPPEPGDGPRERDVFTVDAKSGWIDRFWRVNSAGPSRPYGFEACVELSENYVMTAHASCETQAACEHAEGIVQTVRLISTGPSARGRGQVVCPVR